MRNQTADPKRAFLCKSVLSVVVTGGMFTVALVLFVLSLNTFAWFSKNQKTVASGMEVSVETPDNLMLQAADATPGNEWSHAITWSDETPGLLYPATPDPAETSTGLLYVTNSGAISRHTGLEKTSETFVYDNVENDTDPTETDTNGDPVKRPHYMERTFFVSSQGREWNTTLKATINLIALWEDESVSGEEPDTEVVTAHWEEVDGTQIPDSHMAATVQFLVNGKITGTITVAGRAVPVEIYSGVIPEMNDTNKLEITMRIFFDGELENEEDTGKAYVNTATVDLRGLRLGLKITAEEN